MWGSDKTDMPGTYITGGSGVPASRLRKIGQQLDRRIDRAVELQRLQRDLAVINAKISYQKNRGRQDFVKEKARDLMEERFQEINLVILLTLGEMHH